LPWHPLGRTYWQVFGSRAPYCQGLPVAV
jgi:hypothetical protein